MQVALTTKQYWTGSKALDILRENKHAFSSLSKTADQECETKRLWNDDFETHPHGLRVTLRIQQTDVGDE